MKHLRTFAVFLSGLAYLVNGLLSSGEPRLIKLAAATILFANAVVLDEFTKWRRM